GSNGQETATLLVAQAHRAPGGGIGFLSMIARDITELKRVHGELKVAAEQWQTTFDGITEGIILLDSERRVLRCNSAMQAFLGLPPQDILGRRCCDLVCGLSTTERDCTSVRAIETMHKATTIRQIAGRWFAITVYPMEDRDRALGGIVYIMSDITEQEKAKESLQESEKKIRQLAEASVRAQEEERQWVADEVHDRIAQTLVAVHQQLQALRSAGESGLPTRRQVDRALELQQMAIHETRNIMKDLYSPTLERYGLVAVIQEELRQLRDDLGLQTGIDARCPERPPRHVEGVLYRIIHEALMNVKKHGQGATRVDVSIAWEHDDVGIVVQDDGPGFDIAAVMADKHFGGMIAMRRRAEIIGGTFEVKSSPGKGARVTASVPSRHTKSA
ncbi:MAG: PAS domain-containing protein, partial [Dehalococcoidia bacterium]|nr:PAS domain-containing protein [Dehalococcoidia bacterium]